MLGKEFNFFKKGLAILTQTRYYSSVLIVRITI
ncbi:hypothetical protein predicted by Glimmer/Critica [Limosilactobacillus fermentum]|nr:hypothetical protein predicted by Glimmer/Critica [Limosilactobacillus fermentum]